MLKLIKGKKRILIFGTGAGGASFYQQQRRHFKVVGFVDNNPEKQGNRFCGKQVYSAGEINKLAADLIIIASDYHQEIYHQLVKLLHVPPDKIALFHQFQSRSTFWQRCDMWWQQWIYKRICSQSELISSAFFRFRFSSVSRRKGLKLCKVTWLDQCHNSVAELFKSEATINVYGPSSHARQPNYRPVTRPEIALYYFNSAVCNSTSRSVVLADGTVILERVLASDVSKADYAGGQIVCHSEHRALVRVADKPTQLPKGILINGVSETNYYHWLLETLTQLHYVQQLSPVFAELPILISAHAKKIAAIREILDAIQLKRPVIYLQSAVSYLVGDLYLLTSPCFFVTHFRKDAWCQLEDYYADTDALNFVRNAGLKVSGATSIEGNSKKVFLARKQSLRAYNQQQIWQVLETHGFSEVYMEDLSFAQQVALINQAEFIVGPTGAAWSNLLFAKSGCRALCWMPEEFGDFACFSHLAQVYGVQLDYILYRTGIHDSRELYYRQYTVSPDQVKQWLARLT
ncbi:glycosyltransferase 61 family protein [Rheinheimera sp. FR7-31]|uniref:glycosyltransferase family 61 protein n=1 Tax=Rheinheimera fenheensis TaxID=3152295 RepID=UPI00325E3652